MSDELRVNVYGYRFFGEAAEYRRADTLESAVQIARDMVRAANGTNPHALVMDGAKMVALVRRSRAGRVTVKYS